MQKTTKELIESINANFAEAELRLELIKKELFQLSEQVFTELELKAKKRFRNHAISPDSEGAWLDESPFPNIISA